MTHPTPTPGDIRRGGTIIELNTDNGQDDEGYLISI